MYSSLQLISYRKKTRLKHAASATGSEAGFIKLGENESQFPLEKDGGSNHNLSVITNFANELGELFHSIVSQSRK